MEETPDAAEKADPGPLSEALRHRGPSLRRAMDVSRMATETTFESLVQLTHRFFWCLDEFRYDDLLGLMREDAVWRTNATATLLKVGNEGECKQCKQPLIWLVTKNGKNFPFSEAGLPHFDDCPEYEK